MMVFFVLATGATFGAYGRFMLTKLFNNQESFLLWGTLSANLIGAYCIGLLYAYFFDHEMAHDNWKILLISGFLGSFTTLSAFSLEVVLALQAQQYITAMSLVLLHVGGAFLLTALGLWTYSYWI
ncbi:MAG: fluoride efflux transporter CrcB [Neisseriaceae bacterium]|nr:fluoride efflux transporter CrcB [Neisseriaceae bacterium]